MTKRYYWLKLKTDFFQQRELKKLRKIAGGDTYTIIYLKMLLLAIQQEDCIIRYDVDETKFVEELSLDIDEEPENVIITLSFLKANKMADFGPSDMLLTKVNELVGSETEYAVQKRNQRARQNLINGTSSGLMLDNVQDNVLTEKEIDKEIDKEKRKYIKESGQMSDICPSKPRKEKPKKHGYGEYKNVFLTDAEYEKLQAEFPVDWKRRIETMSGWLAANGKSYKNYLAAIRNWAKKDYNNQQPVGKPKKRDLTDYWEEALSRRNNITNQGWSHPIVYELARKVQWNENNLDFERTLFLVGLNEYDAQHPNEL